ncbi:GlxA family transcriptional regulator [Mesorhizobium sp. WSM3868]|uniref:GlxA family transcriptional regulator n=1 Tax=Mesorhizobium sp. WSM3868 TaxID=2029405 RepID=UPI0015CC0E81|nr:GlxA family transcriptional regulator [Mesorhizobium sp. WSM3868]
MNWSDAVTAPNGEGREPYTVAMLLVPGFSLMALASLVEPLRAANRVLNRRAYEWVMVAERLGAVSSGAGLDVAAPVDLKSAPATDLTVVVASLGVEGFHRPKVFDWLRHRRRGGRLLAGVSCGPLLLAQAGLLHGRRATVHWESQDDMKQRFPGVEVVDALFCVDGDVATAAGGTSSMDMMLAIIAARDGPEVANDVSDLFLRGPVREAQEMQRQGIAWRHGVVDQRLVEAIKLMETHLAVPRLIVEVAAAVSLSERQLLRLFELELGESPSAFYLRLRLKAARQRVLHSAESFESIAVATGFSSPGHFSRAFRKRFGQTPSAQRQASRTAGRIHASVAECQG